VVVGTKEWKKTSFDIDMKKANVAYIKPLLNSGTDFGDGINFPNVVPMGTGVYSPETVVEFHEGEVVEVGKL